MSPRIDEPSRPPSAARTRTRPAGRATVAARALLGRGVAGPGPPDAPEPGVAADLRLGRRRAPRRRRPTSSNGQRLAGDQVAGVHSERRPRRRRRLQRQHDPVGDRRGRRPCARPGRRAHLAREALATQLGRELELERDREAAVARHPPALEHVLRESTSSGRLDDLAVRASTVDGLAVGERAGERAVVVREDARPAPCTAGAQPRPERLEVRLRAPPAEAARRTPRTRRAARSARRRRGPAAGGSAVVVAGVVDDGLRAAAGGPSSSCPTRIVRPSDTIVARAAMAASSAGSAAPASASG